MHFSPKEWDKDRLLAAMSGVQAPIEDILKRLSQDELTASDVYDGLSVKDVLAHLTAWERMTVGWLTTLRAGETPAFFAPGFIALEDNRESVMHALNAKIYGENEHRPLEEVVADMRSTHVRAMELAEATPEDVLFNPKGFPPLCPWLVETPFWPLFAMHSYGHYNEHIELIQAWDRGRRRKMRRESGQASGLSAG